MLLAFRPKHPVKVHVRGGIRMRWTTELCILDGIMVDELYTNILDSSLLPCIQHKYSDSHRFIADNDPKHTSKLVQSFCCGKVMLLPLTVSSSFQRIRWYSSTWY